METINYNKLVRDRIPEIIQKDGKESATYKAEEKEYIQKLLEKLEEEVQEFFSADEEHKIEEIADILEVLYSFCDAKGISREKIEEIRTQKASERGGFQKRIILEETRIK
jgi:predicted house-cleaning noncanonical NTP pyrophosphatase (MazG superfamily)